MYGMSQNIYVKEIKEEMYGCYRVYGKDTMGKNVWKAWSVWEGVCMGECGRGRQGGGR